MLFLKNLPKYQIKNLQKLQNHAARVIFRKSVREHAMPLLMDLHWLPVTARIDYKIALIIYKCLNNLSPSYMSELISKYVPSRALKSGGSSLIVKTMAKYKTLGERAFSINASDVWNSLPLELKNCTSINTFKKNLKTYLFRKHFS